MLFFTSIGKGGNLPLINLPFMNFSLLKIQLYLGDFGLSQYRGSSSKKISVDGIILANISNPF